MIGQTISHYRILERLGGGGMGVVWKAEDTRLGRAVALKLLPPRWSGDAEAKESFLREARATSILDHPNICTIYEVGETNARLFIAMACYEGETLKSKLERGFLFFVEAVDYVRQLAAGLAKSHENDLVHRDIKPGNVFVTHEGQVKILDFGLAKSIGEKGVSMTGLTQGTPAYMAPERLSAGPTDARCDLWSIGVVLYESLSGKSPFLGKNIVETIQKIQTAAAEPLSSFCPAVPAELSRLVAKLLKKEADDRIGTCRELIDALDAIVPSYSPMAREAVRPLQAEPRSVLRSFRLHRRNLTWTIAAAVLVVVLTLFLGRRSQPAPVKRPTLAVLFFDNLSGDPDLEWLRSGIADMLVSDLSQSRRLNVLSTDQIHEALAELEKAGGALSSSVLARQVAERFSADHVVVGSIVSSGGRLRISIRILEGASGKVVTTRQVEGDTQEGLLSIVDDLSLGILQRFEMPPASRDPDLEVGEITTSSVSAWRFYTEGMHLHYQFKEEEAVTLFAKAVELDPGFSMAWAKLAAAERNLGRPEAEEHAARALEGSARLLPRERRYVESFYYSYDVRDWKRGLDASLTALDLDGNHHSVRHNLAVYYSVLELYDEAIRHGEELLRRGYAYPPSYQVLAEAYFLAGEEGKGMALLNELAGRSPEAGFMARIALAWQYRRMGRYDEALERFDQADLLHPGTTHGFSGRCLTYLLRGELEQAAALGRGQQSLTDPAQRLSVVDCQILTALHQGRSEEALTVARGAIAEMDVDRFRARFRVRAARILLARGEAPAALEQVELACREGRGDFTEGEALFYAARTEARLGHADAARELAGALSDFAADVPGKSETRRHRHLLGELALAAGEIETAIAELEAAASLLPLRGVAAEGRMPSHVPLWSSLADAYRSAGRAGDEIRTRELIVRSTDERVYFPVLFVRSLARLGELYEEADEPERARDVRERFLAHWESGDLDRDLVAEVRKNL